MPRRKVMPRKAVRKSAPKKAEPEAIMPDQVYVYFVETIQYGYRRTKRKAEMRTTTQVSKVPPGKLVGIYRLSGTGKVEKKVSVSLNKSS